MIRLSLFDSYHDMHPKGVDLSVEEAELFFQKKHAPGSCFSMAQYRPGGRRCGADVTHVTGAVLDFDTKIPASHAITSQAMASVLKPMRDKGFVHFWYTTKSHRPECPRWRVILPLEEFVPERDWRKVWGQTCSWLKKVTTLDVCEVLDPCTANPNQVFLLPGAYVGGHPLCSRN